MQLFMYMYICMYLCMSTFFLFYIRQQKSWEYMFVDVDVDMEWAEGIIGIILHTYIN